MKNQNYRTTAELAKILGISRIAVYKKIKKGEIKATKIGRNFAIPRNEVDNILGKKLTKEQKQLIDRAVEKTIKEYGETLRLLGQND